MLHVHCGTWPALPLPVLATPPSSMLQAIPAPRGPPTPHPTPPTHPTSPHPRPPRPLQHTPPRPTPQAAKRTRFTSFPPYLLVQVRPGALRLHA